jgi:hypothetical protein
LSGTVQVFDGQDVLQAEAASPVARAGRGETFASRLRVKKGRRNVGTFDVEATSLGDEDVGYTLLVVRPVDCGPIVTTAAAARSAPSP